MSYLEDHFALMTRTPANASRLKELILQLAVRGKLVQQDPKDEPAGVLLEKIRAEKEKLIIEGKVKREKLLPAINEEYIPFKIPDGWRWTRLIGISTNITDGEHISPPKASEGMYLLTAKNVTESGVNFNEPQFVDYKNGLKYRERCNPERGDILICSRGTIGRCTVIDSNEIFCLMGSVILVKLLRHLISEDYINFFMSTSWAQSEMMNYSGATAVKALYLRDIKRAIIPIPPKAEQICIVARVKSLLSKVSQLEKANTRAIEQRRDLGKSLLHHLTNTQNFAETEKYWQLTEQYFEDIFTDIENLKSLRSTCLQLAVQGRLVPQDPTDEPASELLKKIKSEKEKLIKEGKLKREKPLPAIREAEIPYQLPAGWVWCRLGEIGITQTGTTPPRNNPEYFGNFIPFLSPGDMLNGKVNYNNNGLSELGLKKGRLIQQGSVLMVCIGGSIGKAVIVNQDVSCNQQINTIKPLGNIDSLLIYYFLSSPYFQEKVVLRSTGSATPIINKGKWESILFPLPPISEQQLIVEKVERVMGLCEGLERKIESADEVVSGMMGAVVG